MQQIKAIETRYKGYRFRSRLEARWAVFFDALGIEWNYEVEGYELPSGWYLPDFVIGDELCFIEIKPREMTPDEEQLAAELAELSGRAVFVLGSFMGNGIPSANMLTGVGDDGLLGDCNYMFCECESCGAIGIEFDGRSDRLSCKEPHACWYARTYPNFDSSDVHRSECNCDRGCSRTSGNGDKAYNSDSPKILAAIQKAKSARFEHGENG